MSLATPSSVQKLQKALHDKAKESPSYRFYALYDIEKYGVERLAGRTGGSAEKQNLSTAAGTPGND